MLLQFSDGTAFATGATPFTYRPVKSEEKYPRILVQVAVDDLETSAFVDTGGVFLFCSQDVGDSLQLKPEDALSVENLRWRDSSIAGTLHRVELILHAESGVSLPIEVTAFVPRLKPDEEWVSEFPLILGMHGCLEFLRFAVDPSDDTFYFGEIGESHE